MRRGRVFWGSLFILAGGLFLLDNLGLLPLPLGRLFWPLLLVLVGVLFLLRGSMGRMRLQRESVSLSRQGAKRAHLRLQHGAGRLSIGPGADEAEILRGEFSGGVDEHTDHQGESVRVRLAVPSSRWVDLPFVGPGGIEWRLMLAKDLGYELEIDAGAGESKLDLSDLKVKSLSLKTGASSTEVDLPSVVEMGEVRVEAGLASVELRVPTGVAARIKTEAGLAEIDIDEGRFPRRGDAYQSTDFDSAVRRIDIDIQTGLGSIKVK